eukprot:TRINITY_DN11146_c0_g1_i1.p1 TRINITY_DN11146_c0_g1~~TRINITY_DN11146_c0_g1_i1.p1  ORF type:complete len:440 (+),score=94.74 TRINITY_DN11146_c0_g1_i1:49-1368(+)
MDAASKIISLCANRRMLFEASENHISGICEGIDQNIADRFASTIDCIDAQESTTVEKIREKFGLSRKRQAAVETLLLLRRGQLLFFLQSRGKQTLRSYGLLGRETKSLSSCFEKIMPPRISSDSYLAYLQDRFPQQLSNFEQGDANMGLFYESLRVVGGPSIDRDAYTIDRPKAHYGVAREMKGSLMRPEAIAIDYATGNIYVTSNSNNKVVVLSKTLEFVSEMLEAPFLGTPFDSPMGIAINREGRMLIVSSESKRIDCVDLKTPALSHSVSKPTDGAEFKNPCYITCDHQGNFYMGDQGNDAIYKFDSKGQYVAKFSLDNILFQGELITISPQGIAVLDDGCIIAIDYAGTYIYVLNDRGVLLAKHPVGGITGSNYLCSGPDGGFLLSNYGKDEFYIYSRDFQLLRKLKQDSPTGMIFHSDGELIVSSWSANRIVQY